MGDSHGDSETKNTKETMKSKQTKEDMDNTSLVTECLACYSAPALCELRPCLHRVMCLRCTVSLEAAICPACRCSVQGIVPLDGSCTLPNSSTDTESGSSGEKSPQPIAFAQIQRARAFADDAALASTLQIVFAAVPAARAEAQALIDAAIAAYPAPDVTNTTTSTALTPMERSARPAALSGLMRLLEASRRALSSTSSANRTLLVKQGIVGTAPRSDLESEAALASQLPLPAPFAANVCISGRRARLTLFALPAAAEGTADVRAVAGLLRARRPDYVFMAAQSTTDGSEGNPRAAYEWDARLRSVLGAAELPRRSWLLVGARDPRAAAHRAASDVAHALESCPPRERPTNSLRVCQPVADHPRAALRFARSALRYAARARAASTTNRAYLAPPSSQESTSPTQQQTQSTTSTSQLQQPIDIQTTSNASHSE